jgi:glycosyltransferase involved in cell wall biosynthesis
VRRAICRLRPDFVYQRHGDFSCVGAWLAREVGCPLVLEVNNLIVRWAAELENRWLLRLAPLADAVERYVFRHAALLVPVSSTLSDQLLDCGVDMERILINPNGVDPDVFHTDVDGAEFRARYGLGDRTVVGFVGSFDKWHGIEELAEAVPLVARENPGVHFLMIGDGPLGAEMARRLEGLGAKRHVTFVGSIAPDAVPSALAACDIAVAPHGRPRTGRFIGSPTKLFEYMAMGKGIVASDLDQIGEILEDGRTAVLVVPGDPEDLARGILKLADHPRAISRLGAAERRVVLENYTWQRNADRVIRAFDDPGLIPSSARPRRVRIDDTGVRPSLTHRIKHEVPRVLNLSPRAIGRKALDQFHLLKERRLQESRDRSCPTYVDSSPKALFHTFFSSPGEDELRPCAETIKGITDHYMKHRFDLLGSGWVQVEHGLACCGLEGYRYDPEHKVAADNEGHWLSDRINRANVDASRRIWRLVDADYVPIDWHLDFKSGYRWLEDAWYRTVSYGAIPGVDIKVPWELSRMQHLPHLAWAHALAQEGYTGFRPASDYVREFRNQILDFIATNPPRYGVNWHCTMEVAIRIVNWLVSHDLFRGQGATFDEEFVVEFGKSVYQHGAHIVGHLEWSEDLRSNHYLADIAGLLFVAAYLPSTEETDAWLALAVQELVTEFGSQFHPDGSNFEASTCYHRLSAEIVIYATTLVLGLPEKKKDALSEYNHSIIKVKPGLRPAPLPHYPLPIANHGKRRFSNPQSAIRNPQSESPFPCWYFERLEKAAEFTLHITKPNGRAPQIGDNDNGRFLKLQPVYTRLPAREARGRYENLERYGDLHGDELFWDEDHLDHRHLVAAINGLFQRDDLAGFSGKACLETGIVGRLSGDTRLSSYRPSHEPSAAERVRIERREEELPIQKGSAIAAGEPRGVLRVEIPGGDLRRGLQLFAYPDFGYYLYRSNRLYLGIRCGPIGQNGRGGHAHNDQLAIEMNVDGEDWITDPGTYMYTPLPWRRNEYRSVRSHFAPRLDGAEPGGFGGGLFTLCTKSSGVGLRFTEEEFLGRHDCYGPRLYRWVKFEADQVIIIDGRHRGSGDRSPAYKIVGPQKGIPPNSPGYGKREKRAFDRRARGG